MTKIYKYNHANDEILIRYATENDLEALINISRISFPHRMYWCTRSQSKKWWKCSLASKFSETWVSQFNGQVAGYVRLVTDLKKYQKESQELRPDLMTLFYAFSIRPWLLPIKIVNKIIYVTSGRVRYIDSDNPKDYNNSLWAYTMAVLPEMQNKGIGTSMIHFRDQRALELGYDSIKIWIEKKRKVSIRLHEKYGFIRTAKIGQYFEYLKVLSKINNNQPAFSKIQ